MNLSNKLPKAIFTFFWISKLAPKQITDWIKIDDTHNLVQSVSCKYVYDITTFFSVMFLSTCVHVLCFLFSLTQLKWEQKIDNIRASLWPLPTWASTNVCHIQHKVSIISPSPLMDMVSFFQLFDMENFDNLFPQKISKISQVCNNTPKKKLYQIFLLKNDKICWKKNCT